jgi:predicted  nucleic acid-binding Zn-ribbon protein
MSEETSNEVQQEQAEPTTQEAQAVDTAPKAFEIPTEAQAFVGEGKKYQSPEDALRSVPHAQKHIETLESELAQVKEELTKRKTAQELLDEIKSGAQRVENTTPSAEVNQDTLEQLVSSTIERREQASKAKSNASEVASKFTQKYGETAQSAYNQIAKEAGLSVQQLNNLAATSPNAVLKLAGLNGAVTTTTTSKGSINTQTLTGTPSDVTSARVPRGASTKDLVKAWKAAGDKVKSQS